MSKKLLLDDFQDQPSFALNSTQVLTQIWLNPRLVFDFIVNAHYRSLIFLGFLPILLLFWPLPQVPILSSQLVFYGLHALSIFWALFCYAFFSTWLFYLWGKRKWQYKETFFVLCYAQWPSAAWALASFFLPPPETSLMYWLLNLLFFLALAWHLLFHVQALLSVHRSSYLLTVLIAFIASLCTGMAVLSLNFFMPGFHLPFGFSALYDLYRMIALG